MNMTEKRGSFMDGNGVLHNEAIKGDDFRKKALAAFDTEANGLRCEYALPLKSPWVRCLWTMYTNIRIPQHLEYEFYIVSINECRKCMCCDPK